MPKADSNASALSPADARQLRDWVVAFARHWQPKLLDRFVKEILPGPDQPLRQAALLELACIDLRRHWEKGTQRAVADYLSAFPELGATAPLELILAECDARESIGQPPSIHDLVQQYPHHAEALRARYSGPPRPDTEATDAYLTPPPPQADNACLPTIPATIDELPEEFGRYRIQKVLGKGGMGSVYLARDRQLDRLVAMKVPTVRASDRADVLERFYREARIAARLEHPNVCPVYDVGEIKGLPYLTMAYIDGASLLDWTRPMHLRPPPRIAQLVRKIALVMAEAHRRDIVHRDLKPSNVMLRSNGDPVVMDFGVARAGPEKTLFQQDAKSIVGTLEYMAPEQVLGQADAMGPASDVYSLGVILYQLLTGRLPFEGVPATIVYRIVHGEPASPREHRPELDEFLSAICLKAMAKNLAERYPSMDALAAALAAYLQEAKCAVDPTVIPSEPGPPPPLGPATDPLSASLPGKGPATDPIASSPPPGPSKPTSKPKRIVTPAPPTKGLRTMPADWQPPEGETGKRPVGLLVILILAILACGAFLGLFLWKLHGSRQNVPDDPPKATRPEEPKPSAAKPAEKLPGEKPVIEGATGSVARVHCIVLPANATFALHVDDALIPSDQLALPLSLRPGKHRFRLTHGKFTYLEREIEVRPGEQDVHLDLEIANSMGMRLRLIPVGTFQMGAPKTEVFPLQPDENPVRDVTLTRPFHLGVHEVTQEQYEKVMGLNPTSFPAKPDHPVDSVTWENAAEFCRKLSELPAEKAAGRRYRLPTEAEWEHACRAGTTTAFYLGRPLTRDDANFDGSIETPPGPKSNGPVKVGSYPPNAFGLHDVAGNVAEWVNDYYDKDYYKNGPERDPAGPETGSDRVLRGGSWRSYGRECRSADRATYTDRRVELRTVGFRVACDVVP